MAENNKSKIYNGLRARGFNHNQTIAIMANMEVESNFNPAEKQDTGKGKSYKKGEDISDDLWFKKTKTGRGTGLIQWDDRRFNLKKFAEDKGKKYTDLDTQLDFLVKEKENEEKWSYRKFQDMEDPKRSDRENIQNLTMSYVDKVERAGKPHYMRRLQAADRLDKEFRQEPMDMNDFLKHVQTRAKRDKLR